ncbi:HIT domain-containing protein [Teredinibacter franksiae]|jgi:Diadenosine tetraphosphate (Ap4A) hydrolase and other HIT family hydrolases|uniref:HIT domain-containing protein n=1 Tax=Teredinibacter franksiae TaxID=2761453 RepID=UPI001629D1FA|nr:HIT domain-containing protein [Teredinibacter franksiae]
MFELHPQLAENTVLLGQFKLSLVMLHKDANYPWCVLVPKRSGIREIHHLGESDQQQLIRESSHLSEVMTSMFAPITMNIAALGNIVPQLHVHHVARFEGDAAWPASIWGVKPPIEYEPEALTRRVERLRASLVGEGFEAQITVDDSGSSQGFTP